MENKRYIVIETVKTSKVKSIRIFSKNGYYI